MDGDWGPGFAGTPFEALGNVNDAIYAAGAVKLVEKLPEFLEEAQPIAIQDDHPPGVNTVLLAYPDLQPAAFAMLVSNLHSEEHKGLELVSFYPLLEGLPARHLEILNFKPWANELEGMIAVETRDFGDLNFFDPYYFMDRIVLENNTKATFYLAALGFKIQVAENTEIPITEGPIYEAALREFLAEHPKRTREDFTPPIMSMAVAQILIPTKYTGEYQFRALACSKEELDFAGNRLLRYQLVFSNEAAADAPDIWLYAAPHSIAGREPKVGEFIEGIFWLSGYLPQRKQYLPGYPRV